MAYAGTLILRGIHRECSHVRWYVSVGNDDLKSKKLTAECAGADAAVHVSLCVWDSTSC